jgi:hypothetical protein
VDSDAILGHAVSEAFTNFMPHAGPTVPEKSEPPLRSEFWSLFPNSLPGVTGARESDMVTRVFRVRVGHFDVGKDWMWRARARPSKTETTLQLGLGNSVHPCVSCRWIRLSTVTALVCS